MAIAFTEPVLDGERKLTDADLMGIYRERSTGLKGCTIYVPPRNSSHAPRLKVLEGTKARGLDYGASVTLEANPSWVEGTVSKDCRERVEAFVRANLPLLLQFWNGDIDLDCVELAERFIKSPG